MQICTISLQPDFINNILTYLFCGCLMSWLEEKTDDVNIRIMGGLHPSIGGTGEGEDFWLVALNEDKSNPIKRYEAALKGLPYPAAFREAALGLRALIREKVKAKESYEDELIALYRIAVWQSFGIKYSERAQTIGFNILERIPGGVITNLKYEYQTMGYEKLELVNKTDAKRMVELWGEPQSHSTLLESYSSLWKDYEDEYMQIIKEKGYAGLYDISIDNAKQQKMRSNISDNKVLNTTNKFQNFISRIFKGK